MLVRWASVTAAEEMDEELCTCCPISRIEADNSSVAEATVDTLDAACSAAAATAVASLAVCPAKPDNVSAASCMWPAAAVMTSATCLTLPSNEVGHVARRRSPFLFGLLLGTCPASGEVPSSGEPHRAKS